jgi:hypothetical protein
MNTLTLPIPRAAFAQHIIALGKTGAGKSSKLRVLVETLLDAGDPVCIVDPKGDWWGLKSSANGKSAGYPIVIFGGEHADVPINEHSGAHVAELVATGNRPALIDLGGWMMGPRTRFFIDFAAAFFRLARGARHLVIDEVHNFAPQGKVLDVDAGKMLHWANRLASEGRGKGITLIAASQRPQKVHKDFVTSCETLIACRVIHKLDRDAIKDWIDGCADPAVGKEVLGALASMKRAEAWVWSPEIHYGPELVTFPMFRTYDSFRPQPADGGKLKGWAEVDLDDVRAKLETVVEEAAANDPKRLRAEIARLQKLISSASSEAPKTNTGELDGLRARVTALEQDNAALERHWDEVAAALSQAQRQLTAARSSLEAVAASLEPGAAPQYVAPARPAATIMKTARIVASSPARARPATAAPAPSPRSNGGAPATELGKGERVLLTAIAQYGEADPEQLTVLTGYKRSSRDTYLQRLRSAGYVEAGWPARATAQGIAALGEFDPLPTGGALQDYWLDRLGEGEAKILDALIGAHPNGLTREEIDDRAGYKRSSRDTYLQRLSARKLVDKRGDRVFASEILF